MSSSLLYRAFVAGGAPHDAVIEKERVAAAVIVHTAAGKAAAALDRANKQLALASAYK